MSLNINGWVKNSANADSADGRTTAEVRSRLAIYGENDAANVKSVPLWRQFLVRFENPLIIILLIASAVSARAGGIGSYVVIVVIVMISVVFDVVQDVRAQKAEMCSASIWMESISMSRRTDVSGRSKSHISFFR
jgi:magnesium-transporting ATPase (P-type)